jgi:hypothetical protein
MKSFVPTLVLALLLVATVVPAHSQWPLGRDPSAPNVKTGEPPAVITVSGRFQIFVSPNVKGHTFMVDTDTGRVWIMKKDHTSGDFALQRVPVEQVDDQPQPGKEPGKAGFKKSSGEK